MARSNHNCPGSGTGLIVTAGTPIPATETAVSFLVTDSGWAGGGTVPGCSFGLPASAKGAGLASDGNFWKVTLTDCVFATGTDWQVGGRYDINKTTERYIKVVDGPTSSSADGFFTADGKTAWIPKKYPLNVGGTTTIPVLPDARLRVRQDVLQVGPSPGHRY